MILSDALFCLSSNSGAMSIGNYRQHGESLTIETGNLTLDGDVAPWTPIGSKLGPQIRD